MIPNYRLLETTPLKAARSSCVWIDVPCPVCGQDGSQPVLQAPGWNEPTERIYAVVQCDGCHVWYTSPLPAAMAESVGELADESSTAPGATRILAAQLGQAKPRGQWLVHFGLADPTWPRLAGKRGWRLVLWRSRPSEVPATWWSTEGHAAFGTLTDLVENFRGEVGRITCVNWLERQGQLPPILLSWRNLLHPHGRLLLLVPNLDGPGLRQYGGLWRGLDLPYRRVHFTAGSLTQLLLTTGWHIRRFRSYGCLPWLETSARCWQKWSLSVPTGFWKHWRLWLRTCRMRNWLTATVAPLFGQGDWLLVEASTS